MRICAHKDTELEAQLGPCVFTFPSSGFVAESNYCTVVACITTTYTVGVIFLTMSLKPLVYLLIVGYRSNFDW